MMARLRLQFCTDAGEFLTAAADHLAADPVVSTVVTTIAHRVRAEVADGIVQPERDWWLVVRDSSGDVVGAGMRTAPFVPYPRSCCRCLARLRRRSRRRCTSAARRCSGSTGPARRRGFATELARLEGGRVDVALHTRLHELGELAFPVHVPGSLVAATEDDVNLVAEWFTAFMGDADEQAGRPRGASAHDVPDRPDLLRRIRAGGLWFWVDETGEKVHLTSANPPSFGVSRLGPVYTPPTQRGRGGPATPSPRSPAASGRGDPALPLHRPGEPDVEQDLRRPRLPAGRRHGQPGHRPLRVGRSASRTVGSSMVDGTGSSLPSAIARSDRRRILPDRVLGSAATTST